MYTRDKSQVFQIHVTFGRCLFSQDHTFASCFFLCGVYTVQLSDRPVGPTGRSDRSVRQLDRVNGRTTGRTIGQSDESNLSNSSNRLDQQLHRLNVHPTVGPTIGPTMQMRSPNQPIKSTYNHDALNDVIFLSALNIIFFCIPGLLECCFYKLNT